MVPSEDAYYYYLLQEFRPADDLERHLAALKDQIRRYLDVFPAQSLLDQFDFTLLEKEQPARLNVRGRLPPTAFPIKRYFLIVLSSTYH